MPTWCASGWCSGPSRWPRWPTWPTCRTSTAKDRARSPVRRAWPNCCPGRRSRSCCRRPTWCCRTARWSCSASCARIRIRRRWWCPPTAWRPPTTRSSTRSPTSTSAGTCANWVLTCSSTSRSRPTRRWTRRWGPGSRASRSRLRHRRSSALPGPAAWAVAPGRPVAGRPTPMAGSRKSCGPKPGPRCCAPAARPTVRCRCRARVRAWACTPSRW